MTGLHGLDRRARRAAPARDHRRGSARGGQPARVGDVGARQPVRRVRAPPAWSRTAWATPTRACTRTRRCRPPTATSSSRRPTTASSDRSARCSASPRWPTTSASASTPTAPPTVTSCTRCWSSTCGSTPADELFESLNRAGVPCGPINSIAEGVALADRLGLHPLVAVGTGDRAMQRGAQPDRLQRRGAALSPAPARARRARRRDQGVAALMTHARVPEPTDVPHRPRRVRPRHDPPARPDLADDLIGQITFGELALLADDQAPARPTGSARMFEAVLVALADHGFTPDRDRVAGHVPRARPTRCRARSRPGLLGGGSRFLGVTEDSAMFLHDGDRRARRAARRRRRLGCGRHATS